MNTTTTDPKTFEQLVRDLCTAAGTHVVASVREFTDSKGRTYTTDMTNQEIKLELKRTATGFYDHTSSRTDEFAKSLNDQWERKGTLSVKQMPHAVRIALEARRSMVGAPAPRTNQPTDAAECNTAGVWELFKKTEGRLKQPKVTFEFGKMDDVEFDGDLQFKKVTRGRNAGKIAMSDGGEYGRSKFYGYITEDGQLDLYGHGRAKKSELIEVIDNLGTDAGRMAAQYGRQSGKCCFCRKTLTHSQSVSAGFGRTCAKNFGLLSEYQQAK